VPIRSQTADEQGMTSPAPTDDRAAAEGTPIDVAHAAGIDAVARLHDDALRLIASLAEAWAAPVEDVRVLRLAERPTVAQRDDAVAA